MDFKSFINKYFKNSKFDFSKFFRDPKKLMMNMLIILLCGVLLILIGDITSNMASKKETTKSNSIQVNANLQKDLVPSSYEDTIKKELMDTLSEIDGVGQLSVMIYFEGGSQTVPAVNINNSDKKTEEKDNNGGTRVTTENDKNQSIVIVNEGGENKPFIIKQYNPLVGGVVVVAEGATNVIIKERLLLAVKTALNLPINKISIMPMKKSYQK